MSRKCLFAGAVTAFVVAAGIFAFVQWRQIMTARNYVSIAAGLMDERTPLEADVRRQLDVPPALRTRDQAVVYYLLRALDIDGGKYSGANYVLGRHFIDKDCATSLYYFEEHCRSHDCDAATITLIERIRNSGCESVLAGREILSRGV